MHNTPHFLANSDIFFPQFAYINKVIFSEYGLIDLTTKHEQHPYKLNMNMGVCFRNLNFSVI